jgi:hypothetical protein
MYSACLWSLSAPGNREEGLTVASRDAAMALLKKSKTSRLRRGLPPGVEAADKPGELEGVRVDAGIVFAKNRPYVISVMTTFPRSEIQVQDSRMFRWINVN